MDLERGFVDKAREAILDDAEFEVRRLMENLVDVTHANLRAYGRRHGYAVESSIESVSDVQVDRSGGTITARVEWESEQFARWEFGVAPHTIDGDPILSFVWEDPPQWVREEFDQARGSGGQFRSGWRVFFSDVQHPGIPESRALRDAMNGLRRLVQA